MNRDDINALIDFALQAAFGMLVACPVVGAVCLLVYAVGLHNHWWL